MAKSQDPQTSPLFRALRERLVGPDDGVEYYLKGVSVSTDTAEILSRLYTAGGAKAPIGEFLGAFLHQVLTKSEHAALASIPVELNQPSKTKMFRMTERKGDKRG